MANNYEVYQELARIRAATQTNTAIQAVQTAFLNDMNGALDSIHFEMLEVRQSNQEALAAQQEMLRREALQARLEEFIYQTEKFITECKKVDTDLPPSSRYFDLLGILERIKYENINTALIRGRDNKAAFDRVTSDIKLLVKQLERHPEVQEAIAWMREEQRRKIEKKKKSADKKRRKYEEKLERLQNELRKQTQHPPKRLVGFFEWLTHSIINIPRNPMSIALLVVPFVLLFLWRVFFHPHPPPFSTWLGAMFGLYAVVLLPVYIIVGFILVNGPARRHNRQRENKIQKIKQEITHHKNQAPSSANDQNDNPVMGIAYDGEVH